MINLIVFIVNGIGVIFNRFFETVEPKPQPWDSNYQSPLNSQPPPPRPEDRIS